MKKLLLLSFLLTLGFTYTSQSQSAASKSTDDPLKSIIPKPLSVRAAPGSFLINDKTQVFVDGGDEELHSVARNFFKQMKESTGISLGVAQTLPSSNVIVLTKKNASDTLGAEGYNLSVRNNRITVNAPEPAGIFYGCQTIYQLASSQQNGKGSVNIPAADIVDKPRFGWRGLMLDVGRYFYSVDFIKRYIDQLAMHKMNTFHWHLTEDHGWRIEIKKHPKLTQIASARAGTQYGRAQQEVNQTPHWGYYTQDQIRDVVAYAKERFVNVVPEVEMPGHTLAALVAYPELSCTGGPFTMPVRWGIQKDIYCAGNEATFTFLQDVLSEVADLFPSSIIHIGGDEAPKDRWKACAKCQARIKNEGLKDEHELQSYFIRRIENFLLTKNKKIIGWDEILEGGLAPNATVMSWRGIKGGIAAAKEKHDVVMSPTDFLYLDYFQGEPYLEPVAIGGMLTLEKVYSYEPVPEELTPEEAKFIKGLQGNVWGEFIHSPEKVEYMTYPRAAAVAEVGRTEPHLKNWNDFTRRMENQYRRYDGMGVRYAESAYNVWHSVAIDSVARKATLTLKTNSHDPVIRFTVDGSEPTAESPVYTKPVVLALPVNVKAATFVNGKQRGKTSLRSIVISEK